MRKCKTTKCSKEAKQGKFCYSCAKCRFKERNPLQYSFNTHVQNAKRRGIDWNLTFKEFSEFAEKVDLISNAGIYKESYHIDRIDNSKGYEVGNIQILTNSENIKKENRRRKYLQYDFQSKEARFLIQSNQPTENPPF